jgi:hypothetical protein
LAGPAWERGLQPYLALYNRRRPHRSLDYDTPWRYAQKRLTAGAPVLTSPETQQSPSIRVLLVPKLKERG